MDYSGPVLDFVGDVDLSARGALLKNERVEVGAASVDRGRKSGRAAADNDKNADKNSAEADENIQARARSVRSAAKRGNAHLELALRDNNMSMLVQRSNVLPTGQRLTELLAVQEIAPQGVAVALNGAVLPRSRWPDTRLNDGDEIHLFTAIAGG